ncbi:MAG TPA: hypothetical protein VI485_29855 [Vicinamibacterales bacterium]|nr:hypothetical protein [Vicinamibacterales bacterium]
MKCASLSAFVALVVVCPALAQKPISPPPAPNPPSRSQVKSNQYEVVVKGCISSGRLKQPVFDSDPQVTALNASEFILEGPRELMEQLRQEHNGHYDEISGIVSVPRSMTGGTSQVSTKKLGPVSITQGGRNENSPVKEAPRPLRLKVASLTHFNEGCVARH